MVSKEPETEDDNDSELDGRRDLPNMRQSDAVALLVLTQEELSKLR